MQTGWSYIIPCAILKASMPIVLIRRNLFFFFLVVPSFNWGAPSKILVKIVKIKPYLWVSRVLLRGVSAMWWLNVIIYMYKRSPTPKRVDRATSTIKKNIQICIHLYKLNKKKILLYKLILIGIGIYWYIWWNFGPIKKIVINCEADSQKLLRGPLVLLQCIRFYLKLVSSLRERVK